MDRLPDSYVSRNNFVAALDAVDGRGGTKKNEQTSRIPRPIGADFLATRSIHAIRPDDIDD